MYHKPVLLNEVLEHLKVNKNAKYIDATLGDGGHATEILKMGGTVLGLDVNPEALQRAADRIKELGLDENFTGVTGNFKDIEQIALSNGFEAVSGVLFDLGYSTYELEESNIGLSFLEDQPLDMRLDSTLGVTAADLVNALPEERLANIMFNYSDERMSRRFAKAIVEARKLKKIQTTRQLAEIIKSAAPSDYERGRINPATRTFQALRIAVNNELENLENSLPRAARLLLPGGRIVVISFHSLEDGIVKQFGLDAQPKLSKVVKKPLVPTEEEISENPRARSAKMRVFERCAE
ncbi:16S rRNA (cytosine(1402)-N(4))-methyltransferase [candidate division WWE3 bacterium RIFOXYB1_FULL_43_24]|uniref:Ribosomal RNA small subunit methyltransferase H n=1 Tax=candidate division WWE3 bacterium GW2011_GWF1_42_14 TaxID=1619138 RepID=A0A0G0YRY1_UNCKA|nr:MAG: Ribosomal RNA small subunit methyltransferase H [candidate division WWE3 bacterium GW2011_GWA1_42_12]KKS35085.1 MAG: Ribosomal RNA small subunit methyltransferase H [candidate division WWE3 bacterium GW2011_GWD1_42_14]KKS39364.1 MAG: Ribosomal RNA small subunit methyltransferase H [candidate division WWE3 bacterium GW2011_GWF1_42_14]KKS40828.1 MAG: Ribosomal RNA small subunit methyltransferase H [candidate division WWE3 bacterium GW2011_GWE1_42_16]OGC59370.1 MAG: 16S rRNA (cytosine(1402